MTDEKIIKALECCKGGIENCLKCPYGIGVCLNDNYESILMKDTLDLIKRLKMESNRYRNKAQTQKCELARLYKQNAEIEEYRHIEQKVKNFWSELKKLSAFKDLQEPTLTELLEYIEQTNAEAIKEFAERLKNCFCISKEYLDIMNIIDNLVKEMEEKYNA